MIPWTDFQDSVLQLLRRDIRQSVNRSQHEAIRASPGTSLFIVAGPGSGKTTAITLRILKLLFVDEIDPSSVLATTFTRKAAAELRSRILGWGDTLRRHFVSSPRFAPVHSRLREMDFNLVRSGTIDSIAEDLLTEYRAPGVSAPVVLEQFVSNALMLRVGLFNQGRYSNTDLRNFVASLRGSAFGLNTPTLSAVLREIRDRLVHDQVSVVHLRASARHPGVSIACDAIEDYEQELCTRQLFDFARLESEFLTALGSGALSSFFLQGLRFVLEPVLKVVESEESHVIL